MKPVRLVAFDFDGTLVRGDSGCEALARKLGTLEHMRAFESLAPTDRRGIMAARAAMAGWYDDVGMDVLLGYLDDLPFAPGAVARFQRLRAAGIRTAIVSITWEFIIAWAAQRLGADYHVGVQRTAEGHIVHFWPGDKPRWLAALMRQHTLRPEEVAAVGDSSGDRAMLQLVGHRFFVGARPLDDIPGLHHVPDGNIDDLCRRIVATHPA